MKLRTVECNSLIADLAVDFCPQGYAFHSYLQSF